MNKTKLSIPKVVKNVLDLLQIVFIVLRACDVVSWPWYVVLSPLLTSAALWVLCAVICGVAAVSKDL